jgi:polysaccharide biosynthesis protein PslG
VTIQSSHDRSTTQLSPRVRALAAGTLVAAVTLSLLACGGGSPVAAAGGDVRTSAGGGLFGVQPGPTPFDASDAQRMGQARIGTVRIGLNWLWVQPRPGPFNWTRIDGQVGPLAANGVAAVPMLAATPSWVTKAPTTPPIGSPDRKAAWKSFVTAAVRRYGPGGTFWSASPGEPSAFHTQCGCDAHPLPITEWQVWNEPNLVHYFTPTPSPRVYARLLKVTRSAIRDADRAAEVVMAGLSDGGRLDEDIGAVRYLKDLYRIHGAKRSFDAVSIHPYARRVSGVRSVIEQIRKVMKGRHDGQTPMWVTELGWGSDPPNGFGTTKGIHGQRRIVKRAMRMFLDRRKVWHLQRVYWFYWRDPPRSDERLPCRICYSAGLLRSDREPKPAYRVFKRYVRRSL